MAHSGFLVIPALLLIGAIPQPPASHLETIRVKTTGCNGCALSARIWVHDEIRHAVVDPQLFKRTREEFTLSLTAGYYDVSLVSGTLKSVRCTADRYLVVLAGKSRTADLPVRCEKGVISVRTVDGMRGLAGRVPANVVAVSLLDAQDGTPTPRGKIVNGAYYFDEVDCWWCELRLTTTTGATARVAIAMRAAKNFSYLRHDVGAADLNEGLDVKGSPFNRPEQLIEGAQDNIWCLDRVGNRVLLIPRVGTPREIEFPTPFAGADAIAATRRYVWVNEPSVAKILRIAVDGALREYDLPRGTHYGRTFYIVAGQDDRLWFVTDSGLVGAISEDGSIATYESPWPKYFVYDVSRAADGRIWMLMSPTGYGPAVAFLAGVDPMGNWKRLNPKIHAGAMRAGKSGLWLAGNMGGELAYVRFDGYEQPAHLPVENMIPHLYALDAQDGLWFSDDYGNMVAHATMDGRITAQYAHVGTPPKISDMAIAPNGGVWVSEPEAHTVENFQKQTYFPPRDLAPKHLLFDSSGTLWYSDPENDVVGTVVPKNACYALRLAKTKHCSFEHANRIL